MNFSETSPRLVSVSPSPSSDQVYKRRDIAAELVKRAERHGYKAIVVTGDTPRLGRREADIKNK